MVVGGTRQADAPGPPEGLLLIPSAPVQRDFLRLPAELLQQELQLLPLQCPAAICLHRNGAALVPAPVLLWRGAKALFKAVAEIFGLGKAAFVGDGLATMLSGSVGGSGVTTYAENIGVMAVTKVYSTLVFVAAAVIAMLLGFSPKFGALIHTIPAAVIGGASIVVFGLIAVAGARIWVQNRVDLSQNGNLIMVAVTLVLGAGDFALTLGGFTLGGIGTATFGAILLNALLSRKLVDVPPPEVVHQEP